MVVFRVIVCFSILSVSSQVFAAAGWTGFKRVIQIQVNDVGSVEVVLESGDAACVQADGGTWAMIAAGDSQRALKMTLLTTAMAAGRQVAIHCSTAEWPSINVVKMK